MKLTNDQKECELKLLEWFNNPNEFVFVLYGAAGTGKTTLLNSFLKKIKKPVCVTAPTHKAVRVVEHITGRTGKTLQSLHGLRPNFNLESFNIDNVKFDKLGNVYMQNYYLVVVDEASQIGKSLKEYNELSAKQYRTKILYVGDRLQLPPIKENESLVFSNKNSYELKEIVRQQDDNPLLKLLLLLRNDVENGTATCMNYIRKHPIELNNNGEGYLAVKEKEFKGLLNTHFNSTRFKSDINYCRYAAWTNDSVLQWNTFIRNLILEPNSPLIVERDVMTGYKTIIDEFNNTTIINSEDYIVTSCKRRMSDDEFIVYAVSLKPITGGSEIMVYIVDHTNNNSLKNYYNVISRLHYKAKYADAIERSKYWRTFFNYKDRFLVLQGFPIYTNMQKNEHRGRITKDIDYGYGLTVHKLQGSTIENIFVNSIDICYYRNNKAMPVGAIGNKEQRHDAIVLRNKLLYTAISRASKKAIILI